MTSLADEEYINLRSYRRDGGAVDTPVWVAPVGDKLLIFTLGDSFKVKRIGRNDRVQVAKCDVRGKVLGPWVDGTCRAVRDEPDLEQKAYAALLAKYGWKMRIGNFFSGLSGRMKKRLVMEISLA